MPVIHVELSLDSIEKAIEEVKAYQKKVQSLENRVVKRLAEDGAEQARDFAPVETGDLVAGITSELDGNVGYVYSYAEHSAFVEFGTGVVGAGSPYPGKAMQEAGYEYGGGKHHIITKDGRDGWFYPRDDGTYRFTQGQPSKPFMYDTAQLLTRIVPDVVKEELQS